MENHHHKHILIMFLCCLLAILAITILPKYINLGNFAFLLILLCPLSHFILMGSMGKEKSKKQTKSCH